MRSSPHKQPPSTNQRLRPVRSFAASPLLLLLATLPTQAQSSSALSSRTPRSWADAASAYQVSIAEEETPPLCFKVKRMDRKGETTREVIEAREANVARLLERNGQPLSPEENQAEIDRLMALRKNPGDIARHHKDDSSLRTYATEMMKTMPGAMRWTYAPGQPQLPGIASPQVVLDFEPDPAFKPSTLITEALTGLAGRLWIDARTQRVIRAEGRILHQVNFGWGGVLAQIKPGGTLSFQQVEAVPRRWAYAELESHLSLRELLLHTAQENTHLNAWDWHPLSVPVGFVEAIDQLLALNVPLR